MEYRYRMNILLKLIRENLRPMDLLMLMLYVVDPDNVERNLLEIKRELSDK